MDIHGSLKAIRLKQESHDPKRGTDELACASGRQLPDEKFRRAELEKKARLFDVPEELVTELTRICVEGVFKAMDEQDKRSVAIRIPVNPEPFKESVRKIMPPALAAELDRIPQQAFELSFGITSQKWDAVPKGALGFFSASTTDDKPTLYILLHGLRSLVGNWERVANPRILFSVIPSVLRHELRHYLQYVGSIAVRSKNGEELTAQNIGHKEWDNQPSYGTQKTVQGPQSNWEVGPGQKIKNDQDRYLVSPMEYVPQTGSTADTMFDLLMSKLTTIPLSILENPRSYETIFRTCFKMIIENRSDSFLCALRRLDQKRYFKALKNLYVEVKTLTDNAVASAVEGDGTEGF